MDCDECSYRKVGQEAIPRDLRISQYTSSLITDVLNGIQNAVDEFGMLTIERSRQNG
jgi:hypothetical protein